MMGKPKVGSAAKPTQPDRRKARSKDEDFEKLQKLGQGSFGVVYMVKRKQDGKTYVLKQIDTRQMSSMQRKEAAYEATILSKINYEYVVKYFDSYCTDSSINIVMEYCQNGDLGKFLKKQMGR